VSRLTKKANAGLGDSRPKYDGSLSAENKWPISEGVTSLTNLESGINTTFRNFAEWRGGYHGIDFGCSTTISAKPVSKRYNVKNKSAYNSNPALSRIMSILAFLNLEIASQTSDRLFWKTDQHAYRGCDIPPEYFYLH
jgi:hypothetical protein